MRGPSSSGFGRPKSVPNRSRKPPKVPLKNAKNNSTVVDDSEIRESPEPENAKNSTVVDDSADSSISELVDDSEITESPEPKNAKKNPTIVDDSADSSISELVDDSEITESPEPKNAKKNSTIVDDSADSSISELVDDSEITESPEPKNAKKNSTVIDDSADSSISELVDDSEITESPEPKMFQSFVFPLDPEDSILSENIFLHDLSSLSSSGISSDMYITSIAPTNLCQSAAGKTSLEAEIAIKYLRQALFQDMNSADIDVQSKRLSNAMVEVVLQECCGSTQERSFSNSFTLKKMFLLGSLSFLLAIFAVLFSSLYTSSAEPIFLGPLPT